MTATTLRERAAALCDAAAARWRVLAPGESVASDARRERGNEASALAAEIRALPATDAEALLAGALHREREAVNEVTLLRARLAAAEAAAEWERAGAAMVVQDCAQDTSDLARLHALVRCEPSFSDLHDHTACVVEEFARLRAGGDGR